MIKHFRCPKCGRSSSTFIQNEKYIPECKCGKKGGDRQNGEASAIRTKMEEI